MLEDLVFESNPLILQSIAENNFYMRPDLTTEDSVVDHETQRLIELEELYKSIDFCVTDTGKAVLYRSLTSPPLPLEVIHAKQKALRELEDRPDIRASLDELLATLSEDEGNFYNTMRKDFEPYPFSQYSIYKKARRFFMNLSKMAQTIPKPHSDYLNLLVNSLQDAQQSEAFDLFKGPVFRTFRGIRPRNQMRLATPFRYKFTMRPFKWSLVLPIIPFMGYLGLSVFKQELIDQEALMSFMMCSFFPFMVYVMSVMEAPLVFDRTVFINPLVDKYLKDAGLQRGVEAVGRIDELLSFLKYAESLPFPTTIPDVSDSKNHYFVAKGVRNPVLVKTILDFVPNDIVLDGQHLTFITGPNSGGKTTYCKTVAQIQLMAQIGARVPAESMRCSVADRIFYQAPEFDSLKDKEGRFGKEIERTAEIYYTAKPRTISIFDELAEGTTFEEKTYHSEQILRGFNVIGNNTILVTHNHELVESFKEKGIGVYLQTGFQDDEPTFQLIPGISNVSHADRIAKKKGLSEEDILNHLIKEGYLPPGTEHLP